MSIFSKMGQATRIGYDNMIRARQRQAERYVAGALLTLDDETLARAGYSRKELEKRRFSPL
jgi:hypothetical protein